MRGTAATTGWVLGLALAVAGCGGGDAAVPAGTVTEERVAAVRTRAIEPRRVEDLALLSADLLPWRRATLAAEVPGRVEAVSADFGDRVVAGRVLARIDTRALTQQVAEAEALWRQAQDRFERAEKLFEKRSITSQQLTDARAERDVAEARRATARLTLEKSDIRMPWSGRVAARRVEVGDYVSPGQPVFELVEAARLRVRAAAPASEVPFLRVGAPVRVSVDVLPEESFTGELIRIGAELDPDTRTLDVEAVVDNADGRLKPGLFGKMEVRRRVLEEALLVPLAALIDFEDQKVVYVMEEGRARRRAVSLGPVVGAEAVVESGLAAGERLIVGGQQQVADGQRVAEAEGA